MSRSFPILVFCLSALGIAASVVLQYGFGLMPCVLCQLQYGVMWLLTLCAGAMLCLQKYPCAFACMRAFHGVFYGIGLLLAWRHTWLLHFNAAPSAACLPDLVTLWHLSTWQSWWGHVLSADGCGHMATVLGFGLPDVVLLWYGLLGWATCRIWQRV